MAKTASRDTFLSEAEKVMRELAMGNPDIVIWRGRYPHKHIQSTYEYETILAGMSDDKSSKDPPTIVVMEVWLESEASAKMVFKTGSADDTFRSVPFSGGHNPLKEVRELSKRLQSL